MIYTKLDAPNLDLHGLKYLVVGAGLFGCTIAERIAADKKGKVVVIERRAHIGGNSYSEIERQTGIECHKYGSHIFHTKREEVWRYVLRFSSFNSYRHKVFSRYRGKLYPIPINLATINSFYGLNLSPLEARQLIFSETEKEKAGQKDTLEGRALSVMGRPLYEAFIKGYTEKQWGTDPIHLFSDIIDRLPVRFDYNAEYFEDPWQGIPVNGYGELIRRMLSHENIDTYLGIDFFSIRNQLSADCLVVFTGSIDGLFDYRYGRLKWRSLRFEREILPVGDYQGTAVINFAEKSPAYTRIHEFRHYHKERSYPADQTVIVKEYPIQSFDSLEPYYPVNTQEDKKIHQLYIKENRSTPNIIVGGRLGSYSYMNMDQTILSAMNTYEKSIKDWSEY